MAVASVVNLLLRWVMNIVHWLPRYYRGQAFLRDLPRRGARVLDIACGEGDLACWMAERGARVVGADLIQDEIRRGWPPNQHRNVSYITANAGALPIPTGALD